MTLPVTIPNTFATATASIPLSQLDTNFTTLANAVNGISDGSETLANAKITTANVTTLIVTGNATIGDASADTVTLNSTMTANTAVIFSAGTSAAPAITTSGDLNTGIYFPGADRVGITTGGTQRVEVDASGDVGISITPSTWSSSFVAMQVAAGLSLWASKTINSAQAGYISNNVYFDGSARKYINTGGASEYVISAGNHEWYTATSGTAGNNITFTERARITSDGYLRMASGTGGIQFNGDTAAGNALDDYEEGTWTPVLTRTETAPVLTYSTQSGRYTKVGRIVIASIDIQINAISSAGAGNNIITGLPFSSTEPNYGGLGIMGYNDAFVNTVYSAWTSSATIYFRAGTRSSTNDNGGWSAGGYLNLTMVYQAT